MSTLDSFTTLELVSEIQKRASEIDAARELKENIRRGFIRTPTFHTQPNPQARMYQIQTAFRILAADRNIGNEGIMHKHALWEVVARQFKNEFHEVSKTLEEVLNPLTAYRSFEYGAATEERVKQKDGSIKIIPCRFLDPVRHLPYLISPEEGKYGVNLAWLDSETRMKVLER